MSTELLQKIIDYLSSKPYKEVYMLMDAIRLVIVEMQKKQKEGIDGNVNEEHSRDE